MSTTGLGPETRSLPVPTTVATALEKAPAPAPAAALKSPNAREAPVTPPAAAAAQERLVLLPARRIGYDVRARISTTLVQARARVSHWMQAQGMPPPSRTRSLSVGRHACGLMHVQQDAELGLDALDAYPYQLLAAAGNVRHETADVEMTAEQSYRETEELLFSDYLAHETVHSFRLLEHVAQVQAERATVAHLEEFMRVRAALHKAEGEMMSASLLLSRTANEVFAAEDELDGLIHAHARSGQVLADLLAREASYKQRVILSSTSQAPSA